MEHVDISSTFNMIIEREAEVVGSWILTVGLVGGSIRHDSPTKRTQILHRVVLHTQCEWENVSPSTHIACREEIPPLSWPTQFQVFNTYTATYYQPIHPTPKRQDFPISYSLCFLFLFFELGFNGFLFRFFLALSFVSMEAKLLGAASSAVTAPPHASRFSRPISRFVLQTRLNFSFRFQGSSLAERGFQSVQAAATSIGYKNSNPFLYIC